MRLVSAENITLDYDHGKTPVLQQLSFNISSGEHWQITGPSGAGKTSLLRLIVGLIDPSSGSLERRFQRPAFAFSEPRLIQHLSTIDNLRLVSGNSRDKEIEAGLEALGLNHLGMRSASSLSKGQAQRVALLRALLVKPDILLLDEALSGLDEQSFAQASRMILDSCNSTLSSIIEVSHNPDRYSGRVGDDQQIKLI